MPLIRSSDAAFNLLVPQTRVDPASSATLSNAPLPGTPITTISNNEIELTLFHFPKTVKINSLTLRAGTTGFGLVPDGWNTHLSTFNFGIYNNYLGLPGGLAASVSLILDRTNTANSFITISADLPIIREGLYWVAYHPVSNFGYDLAGILGPSAENRHSLETLLIPKIVGNSTGSSTSFLGLSAQPTTGSTFLPSDLSSRSVNYATGSPTQTLMRLRTNAIFYRFSYT